MFNGKRQKVINALVIAIMSGVFVTAYIRLVDAGNNNRHSAGEELVEVKNFNGVEMVLVPEGELPGFWISRYEVSQHIYESVMGENPSYFKGAHLPVEQVSWYQALEFCNRLSVKCGFKPYYTIDKKRDDPENRNLRMRWAVVINKGADGFRLPSSAEWEYAARAGSKGDYFWGDEMDGDYCWYNGNSSGTTHDVSSKRPNRWGIYNICGNVREWCFEWHPNFEGLYRIVRDGHYSMRADNLKISQVDYQSPQFEFGFIGIRLARNK